MPITKKKVTKRLKLNFGDMSQIPTDKRKSVRDEIKRRVGELLIEETNKELDASRSPVSGGKFVKKKVDKSSSILFEDGDLRAAISYEEYRDGVELGVFDESEAPKAYGHQTGFKGHPNIPSGKYVRQIVPNEDQSYKEKINRKINSIIREVKSDESKG